MNTPTPEEINRVLDDQLFRLRERWPNDSVALTRWWSKGDKEPHWYAVATSQGNGPHASTADDTVTVMLARNADFLKAKKEELLSKLEAVEAELAAQKEKGI